MEEKGSYNMHSMHLLIIFLCYSLLTGCGRHYISTRSPLRSAARMPKIVVADSESPHTYGRTSSHYKENPIFTIFDETFFFANQVPASGITYNNADAIISREMLDQKINAIITAVMEGITSLPGCTILRDSNFNYNTQCGLLIIKLDHYPFVVKLFRETAESFVQPLTKGLEPASSFFMAGGSNRHITGLSRLPNREYLLSVIEADPHWREIVQIPRKWYWVPESIAWLTIDGYHFKSNTELHTKIPALYAVVADYMELPHESNIVPHKEQEKIIMDLCCTCNLHLDPHLKNFIVYQTDVSEQPTIAIVDTEDHQCMTGLNGAMTCANYIEWYLMLGTKFLCDAVFHIKT